MRTDAIDRVKRIEADGFDVYEAIKQMLRLFNMFDVEVFCYTTHAMIYLLKRNPRAFNFKDVIKYPSSDKMVEDEIGMCRFTLEDPGVYYDVRFVAIKHDNPVKFSLVLTPKGNQ